MPRLFHMFLLLATILTSQVFTSASDIPTRSPTSSPSGTITPTNDNTTEEIPTAQPTSISPTLSTMLPTKRPAKHPTARRPKTKSPTRKSTKSPPTKRPTRRHAAAPSKKPSTSSPTTQKLATSSPTTGPTSSPTTPSPSANLPTREPTGGPTGKPTMVPTKSPQVSTTSPTPAAVNCKAITAAFDCRQQAQCAYVISTICPTSSTTSKKKTSYQAGGLSCLTFYYKCQPAEFCAFSKGTAAQRKQQCLVASKGGAACAWDNAKKKCRASGTRSPTPDPWLCYDGCTFATKNGQCDDCRPGAASCSCPRGFWTFFCFS